MISLLVLLYLTIQSYAEDEAAVKTIDGLTGVDRVPGRARPPLTAGHASHYITAHGLRDDPPRARRRRRHDHTPPSRALECLDSRHGPRAARCVPRRRPRP